VKDLIFTGILAKGGCFSVHKFFDEEDKALSFQNYQRGIS